MKYLQARQSRLSRLGGEHGLPPNAQPIVFQLYSEPLQKFRLAATTGHGAVQPPEDASRPHPPLISIRCPFWYPPLEEDTVANRRIPAARDHPAAHGDVSFLGIAECLAAPDHGSQLALSGARARRRPGARGRRLGVGHQPARTHQGASETDGRASIPIRCGHGTPSASGQAPGISPLDARKRKQGFLLNHIISELLPERDGGYRYSNSDPITGQAAWYDLRCASRKPPTGSRSQCPSIRPSSDRRG